MALPRIHTSSAFLVDLYRPNRAAVAPLACTGAASPACWVHAGAAALESTRNFPESHCSLCRATIPGSLTDDKRPGQRHYDD